MPASANARASHLPTLNARMQRERSQVIGETSRVSTARVTFIRFLHNAEAITEPPAVRARTLLVCARQSCSTRRRRPRHCAGLTLTTSEGAWSSRSHCALEVSPDEVSSTAQRSGAVAVVWADGAMESCSIHSGLPPCMAIGRLASGRELPSQAWHARRTGRLAPARSLGGDCTAASNDRF